MARNVEIKARARDMARQSRMAEALATAGPEHLEQRDVFFRVEAGRLKLRHLSAGRGELIVYARPDLTGPKISSYEIYPTASPAMLESVLTRSLGVLGVVVKRRTVWFYEQVRIHLDVVEGLGDFLELEVVLGEGEPVEHGRAVAERLMGGLAIEAEDLLAGAYIDMLTGA